MVCNKCNNQVNLGAKFCAVCGSKVENEGKENSISKPRPFVLSKNEVEIKTYCCTTFEKPFAKGYITVTNKRVMFYAFGQSSKRFSEVYINKITGVSSYYGTGHNIGYLKSLVIPILIAGIGQFLDSLMIAGVGILGVLYCIVSYIFRKELQYRFSIIAEGSDSSPISIGAISGELTGQGAAIATQVIPTGQAHIMMKELGAMILDLKNLGDHAISIWKEDIEESMEIELSSNENTLEANIFG